jgi:8-oxo-dGTP diphosphatase
LPEYIVGGVCYKECMIKHNHESPSRPRSRPRGLPRTDVGYALISDPSLEKILMVCNRRSSGLSWILPGGSREPGETLEETVVRETREETGLHVVVEGIVAVGERLRNSHVLIATFVAKVVGGRACLQNDEDVVKVEWATFDVADHRMPWYPGGVRSLLQNRGAVHYSEFLY